MASVHTANLRVFRPPIESGSAFGNAMFYIVKIEFYKNSLQQQYPSAQHISTLRRKVIVAETGAESEELRVKGP